MNRQEILTVLIELHRISGFRVSLHGTDFAEIAAYPDSHGPFCRIVNRNPTEHRACLKCDEDACHRVLSTGKTYIYKCRFGLTEAVSPLYNFGSHTGFLMMGQIIADGDDMTVLKTATEILSSNKKVEEAIAAVPRVKADMIRSYVRIMTICAQYLTLTNAVISERRTLAEEAAEYIGNNLDKKLSISKICSLIGCSKSTLITSFKKRYGTTVNSFTADLRLKKAEGLLMEGKRSISEISATCGFSDQSYFSKVFSAKFGIPPTEYRAKRYS